MKMKTEKGQEQFVREGKALSKELSKPAHIVKCVNSHTELVNEVARLRDAHEGLIESLRECIQIIESQNDTSKQGDIRLAVSDALEALAKAEGKE